MKKLISILTLAYCVFVVANNIAGGVVSKAVNNQAAVLANI